MSMTNFEDVSGNEAPVCDRLESWWHELCYEVCLAGLVQALPYGDD